MAISPIGGENKGLAGEIRSTGPRVGRQLTAKGAGQLGPQGGDLRRRNVRADHHMALTAQLGQGQSAVGIGSQEDTVTAIGVVDQQGRFAQRQPQAQQVVSGGDVLFRIVNDEVAIPAEQVAAKLGQGQQVVPEELDLKRPIEEVLVQAGTSKGQGYGLDLIVDAQPGRLTTPGALEPGGDLVRRKANGRGFVQVVDGLAHQAGAGDGDAVKRAAGNEGLDDTVHRVLGRLQGQEMAAIIGPGKAGCLG
jgi:hypothetical protein